MPPRRTTPRAASFDANSILVGDATATTAAGGISTTTTPLAITSAPYTGSSVSSVAAAIQTNVQSTVNAAIAAAGSTSLYSRITFNAANLASLTSLTLRMQYDSGYVAYLNGVEIASSNAPTSPAWNSTAVENLESPVQVTTYQDVDVSSFLNASTTGHLMATGNVLAIQTLLAPPTETISSITYSGTTATVTTASANGYCTGDQIEIAGATPAQYDGLFTITVLNGNTFTYTMSAAPGSNASGAMTAASTNTSLLMVPELCQMTSVVGRFMYSTPTPGVANTLADIQPSITFSSAHGLYSSPFQLTLTPDAAGTPIYYTTDNTAPSQAIASITYSGTTATATTPDPVGFDTGDQVVIAGATPAVYDGTFAITVSSTYTSTDGVYTFTYTLPTTPTANATGAAMTATHGTLYTGPITISTTTVVQAAMVVGGIAAPYQTETTFSPPPWPRSRPPRPVILRPGMAPSTARTSRPISHVVGPRLYDGAIATALSSLPRCRSSPATPTCGAPRHLLQFKQP